MSVPAGHGRASPRPPHLPRDPRLQTGVAGKADDVVHALHALAPGYDGIPGEAGIGPQDDAGVRPKETQPPRERLEMVLDSGGRVAAAARRGRRDPRVRADCRGRAVPPGFRSLCRVSSRRRRSWRHAPSRRSRSMPRAARPASRIPVLVVIVAPEKSALMRGWRTPSGD